MRKPLKLLQTVQERDLCTIFRILSKKLKRAIDKTAYEAATRYLIHVETPSQNELAAEEMLNEAKSSLDLLGFTVFRDRLSTKEIKKIFSEIVRLGCDPFNLEETKVLQAPLEKSHSTQEIVLSEDLLSSLREVIGSFWYCGSDGFCGYPIFPPHRDTFVNPPFIKIFIPLVECKFSILPGSHHYQDNYARAIGKHLTTWDTGHISKPVATNLYFDNLIRKKPSKIHRLHSKYLMHSERLKPGDLFIFNQNIVHSLESKKDRNIFISFSVVPSPEQANINTMSRKEHVDALINNIAATSSVGVSMSSNREVPVEEVIFTGYKFSPSDLDRLINKGGWNDYFGLRFITKEHWKKAFEAIKSTSPQHIQDNL